MDLGDGVICFWLFQWIYLGEFELGKKGRLSLSNIIVICMDVRVGRLKEHKSHAKLWHLSF